MYLSPCWLSLEAQALKEKFNAEFWLKEKEYFALALDKNKAAVATITSNPGHGLWSAIIEADKARPTAERLLAEGLFSGWGIGTMSAEEKVYSPLSYHNGSVWPHDNAQIALGLAKYNFSGHLQKLVSALFKSAAQFDRHRLPELYCGFSDETQLIPYPAGCSPQAWAAGAPFACIQALLNMRVERGEVQLAPTLPEEVDWLKLQGLAVGDQKVNISVYRTEGRIEAAISRPANLRVP